MQLLLLAKRKRRQLQQLKQRLLCMKLMRMYWRRSLQRHAALWRLHSWQLSVLVNLQRLRLSMLVKPRKLLIGRVLPWKIVVQQLPLLLLH